MSRRALSSFLVAAACALVSSQALAQDRSNEQLFSQGVSALQQGDYDQAIALFEALADRGYVHPDATYDRGLAYVARVRAKAEHPGDLGRAVAAFEETLLTRPGDKDAEQACDLVRAEIARRHSRRGMETVVQARPPLDRIIAGLASEQLWAVSALLSSLVLSVGLVFRHFKKGPGHIISLIATSLGAAGLILFGSIAATARHLRLTTRPAVVVVSEARLLNEQGVAQGGEPIPEAARVEVQERRGELVRIGYGSRQGWTHASSVRMLGPQGL